MFIIEKVMPNGSVATYHKAIKFEIQADSIQALVNSYHLGTMDSISWQDTYPLAPTEAIQVSSIYDVEVLLTSPGAPFEGGVVVAEEQANLDTKKARKKAEVKLKRDKVEWAGVTTAKGLVDSDPDAQRKINGAVTMALIGGESFSIDWRMKDNSVVQHDAAEIIALGVAVGQYVTVCQERKNTLDAAIDAAQTEEELSAIDINTGWPQ